MCHTSIFSCCSSVFIGTYEKTKQFGFKLTFPMTWQSYIIWPHSSPAWKLQFGTKQDKSRSTISTGRDTNRVVMQIHLKCSGMIYNYKEILHFSYQKNGSHIWNFEIPSLSEMQVPDQRVKLQSHRQVGIVTTTHRGVSELNQKNAHEISCTILRDPQDHWKQAKTTEDHKVQHLLSNL